MPLEEVVHIQRVRGQAFAVENLWAFLIWNQDPIKCSVDQLGMTTAVVDMRACEKRRPDAKELVKRPPLFNGTKEVCEAVGAARTGDQPTMPGPHWRQAHSEQVGWRLYGAVGRTYFVRRREVY